MRVLIAGASGALGLPLARALVASGHEVIGLSRTAANRDRLRALGAEPVIADALDRDALLGAVAGLRADAVVHILTALRKMPTSHHDMAVTNALRIDGTANLLAAARAIGACRFAAESMISGYGFGDFGTKVITEEDQFAPPGHGPFEQHLAALRSKEQQTFSAEGIAGIALRFGLIYGPGAGLETMVDMLRRRRLPVPRNGGGVRSWVYIEDAVAALVAALERGRPRHAYNIVDDEPVAWRWLMEAIAKAFGTPRPLAIPGWALRPMPYAHAVMTNSMRVSNGNAKRELGWTPVAPTYRDGILRAALSGGETRSSEVPAPGRAAWDLDEVEHRPGLAR